MKIEEAFERSGGMGKYQIFRLIIGAYLFMIVVIITLCLPFFMKIDITCELENNEILESCTPEIACRNRNITYKYTSNPKHKIISEFNILCEFSFIAAIGSGYFFGGMIFGYIYGQVADIYGRRICIGFGVMVSILGQILFMSANVNKWLLIFGGVLMGSCSLSSPVLNFTLDGIPGLYSNISITILSISWGICSIFIGAIMYFHFQWKIQIFIIFLIFLLALVSLYYNKEGPRYLIAKNKYEAAMKLFEYIAKVNGVKEFPKDGKLEIQTRKEREKQCTIIDAFRYPSVSRKFILMLILMLVTGSTYYGVILDMSKLSGSIEFNTIMAGVADLLGTGVSSYGVSTRLGRRWTLIICFLICGIGCLFYSITQTTQRASVFSLFLIIFIKLGISGAYHVCYVFAAELFPTVIRGAAFGAFVFVVRVGSVCVPIIVQQMHQPLIFFGLAISFMALFTLPLPETRNKILIDHIPELTVHSENSRFDQTSEYNQSNELVNLPKNILFHSSD